MRKRESRFCAHWKSIAFRAQFKCIQFLYCGSSLEHVKFLYSAQVDLNGLLCIKRVKIPVVLYMSRDCFATSACAPGKSDALMHHIRLMSMCIHCARRRRWAFFTSFAFTLRSTMFMHFDKKLPTKCWMDFICELFLSFSSLDDLSGMYLIPSSYFARR